MGFVEAYSDKTNMTLEAKALTSYPVHGVLLSFYSVGVAD